MPLSILNSTFLTGVSALGLFAVAMRVEAQAQTPEQAGVTAAADTITSGILPVTGQRVLEVGTDVFRDEQIVTNATGLAQLVFLDQSTLTIGPNSTVVIDRFVFDPATGAGELALGTAAGAFRFLGGRLSEQGAVQIGTPLATIGIRGSILRFTFTPDGLEIDVVEGQDILLTPCDPAGTSALCAPGAERFAAFLPPGGLHLTGPGTVFISIDGTFTQGPPRGAVGPERDPDFELEIRNQPEYRQVLNVLDDTTADEQQDEFDDTAEEQAGGTGGGTPPPPPPGSIRLTGWSGGFGALDDDPSYVPITNQGSSPPTPDRVAITLDPSADTVEVDMALGTVDFDDYGGASYGTGFRTYTETDPAAGSVFSSESFEVPIEATDVPGRTGLLATHDRPFGLQDSPSLAVDELPTTFELFDDDSPMAWGRWAVPVGDLPPDYGSSSSPGPVYDQGFFVTGADIASNDDLNAVPPGVQYTPGSLFYEGGVVGLGQYSFEENPHLVMDGDFALNFDIGTRTGEMDLNFDGRSYNGEVGGPTDGGSQAFAYTGALGGSAGDRAAINGSFYNNFDDTAGSVVIGGGDGFYVGSGIFGGEVGAPSGGGT